MAAAGDRRREGLSGRESDGAEFYSDDSADEMPARRGWRRVVAAVVMLAFSISVVSLGFIRSAYHHDPFERFLGAPLGTR